MILGSIFKDGAVFQQQMDIPVWGWTLPRKSVKAFFDGEFSRTCSSEDGYFILYLPPHAAGGPFELTVQVPGHDDETVVLKDILVGEVWLASGQSNMAYKLNSDWRVDTATPADKTLGRVQERQFNEMSLNPDELRVFTVAERASITREDHCAGCWVKVDRYHSGDVSAVAAWFALGLQYQLNIPIGIIDASWGGSIAEAWMSMDALWAAPETREAARKMQEMCRDLKVWDAVSYYENNPDIHADPGNTGTGMGYADKEFDDSAWQDMTVGGSWIQQGIAGNGVIWARCTVEIPESWANTPLMLLGGAVDKQDISYFNGVEIGRSGSGFDTSFYATKRQYPVPAEAVKPGKAVVAIRAYSFAYDGAITGKWVLLNEKTDEVIELGCSWKAKAEYDWGVAPKAEEVNDFNPGAPTRTPTMMFNGMINPLLPTALRGTIWYQGESNAGTVAQAKAYRDVLQAMIDDWRRCFRNADMPFIQVQLAGFESTTSKAFAWAELRESQRLLAKNDPDCYMISAVDIGNENDIHPENKLDVGKRLAACALHHVYGCSDLVPSGPEVVKAVAENNGVRLSFDFAEKLKLKKEIPAFELAGSDGIFHYADKMEINEDDNTLYLSSPAVTEVCRVRYAWKNCPEIILFNGAGFPASPFDIQLV
ncbi:MAG: sialate O-acetylesterase [Lentisphaerae bacterium]|nr:sialate O-acetylesterase [Lentisphaerota bacterium]